MRMLLIAALSATAISGVALAQETVTGAPKGTAPATTEGYDASSSIVCDQAGTTCWHSVDRYDYPANANVVVHPHDWRGDNGVKYAWKEHPGRGYWQGSEWQQF